MTVKSIKKQDIDFMNGQNNEDSILHHISEKKKKFADYITEDPPAQVEEDGPETKNGIIINSLYVKMRKEPDFESDVIELLKKGDRVIMHERSNEFYRVSTTKNRVGYIAAQYVTEE